MGKLDDAERVAVESIEEWRAWLDEHAGSSGGVWAVLRRRTPGEARLSYEDAVVEALCFGWIDGQTRPLDEERTLQWFAPRSPTSAWAATNKARVARLEAEGRMRPEGQRLIDLAKANGMWTVLEGPDAGIEPPELRAALDAVPAAREAWDSWPPSVRKLGLTAIALAKRPETKTARISKIVADAAAGRRPT